MNEKLTNKCEPTPLNSFITPDTNLDDNFTENSYFMPAGGSNQFEQYIINTKIIEELRKISMNNMNRQLKDVKKTIQQTTWHISTNDPKFYIPTLRSITDPFIVDSEINTQKD